MLEYIGNNLKYPKQALEQGVDGRVVVNFVVDENGRISDVKTVRGIGSGCDAEAERVVRSMPPWKAGKQNGKAVKVSFSLPILFELQ
jgi:protein TonB